MSLNQELMSGPDLTNQIVGIMLEGKVVFVAELRQCFTKFEYLENI